MSFPGNPGTEACDAVGGALRRSVGKWPARVVGGVLSVPRRVRFAGAIAPHSWSWTAELFRFTTTALKMCDGATDQTSQSVVPRRIASSDFTRGPNSPFFSLVTV